MDIVNKKDFQNCIKNKKLIIIDFWAPYCSSCMAMKPIMEEFKNVHYVDVESCDENLLDELEVNALPTVLFYKEGKQVYKYIGPMSKGMIYEVLTTFSN